MCFQSTQEKKNTEKVVPSFLNVYLSHVKNFKFIPSAGAKSVKKKTSFDLQSKILFSCSGVIITIKLISVFRAQYFKMEYFVRLNANFVTSNKNVIHSHFYNG